MASIDALRGELRRSIDGEVRFDGASLALYSTDASNYRRLPVGVVIPRHEGDVVKTVALARENGIPLLPRGGGTALAGQTTNTALVLDLSKYMNRMLQVDPERRRAIVQPGLVQAHLNAQVAQHGLFFAPDPATKDRCTLGGMIGNNSCGAHSAAYGKTVDNVAWIDALLYDGTRLILGEEGAAPSAKTEGRAAELQGQLRALATRYGDSIRQRYPKIPRRVSGYNLDQLLAENRFNLARAMVGSEGTLAVVLAAEVHLVPRPNKLAMVVLGFDDVFVAADQTPWLLGHRPEALEGFDHKLPDFARAKGMAAVRLLPAGKAFLVLELGGDTDEAVLSRAHAVKRQAEGVAQCSGVAILPDGADQRAVWGIRESGLGAGALIPGHPRTWPGAEDCAVPPARLGDFLRRLVALLSRYDLAAATYYGHFGEGCVHCRINFDFFTVEGIARFRAAMVEIGDLVAEFGGSLSGEHGDGLARSELLPKMFGAELIGAFREFKEIFDPNHRMNPGVIVDPEPLDAHLRIGASYKPEPVRTRFDFSAEGGLAGAALKCVGIGKCRKTDAGVMCPSYMATREETYSTRGRARLLFEALTGGPLAGGFTDQALYDSLELCLSCKACKTECPAGVDMAAYKAEFMANYYASHWRSPQARFFGRIHEVARLAALAPGAANLSSRGGPGATVRRLLRIHPERQLPRFASRTFRDWFKDREPRNPQAQEVLLFPDTFSNFFEPEVAIAATEVLERAGFRVVIPARDLCCGRPLYDQGMLDAARRRLLGVIEAISPFVERGISVVGLEPSCLLTFRDELPGLFPRVSSVGRLAENSLLLDEFLAAKAPGFAPPALAGPALVHGHCHRQAIAGMGGEVSLLKRAPGLAIHVPDAGCCGMAGAFGYDTGRFGVSRTIGERVLLPAIRASAPDTLIVADGFACRSQIRQFCADRRPLHLAQVLNLNHGQAGDARAVAR